MKKQIGNIRIRPNPGSDTQPAHYEIDFLPYSGRLNTQTVRVNTYDDLVAFLINFRISEDEATRWAGRARTAVILIPNIERTDDQLKDSGLMA